MSDAPRDSDERKLLNLIGEQARPDESPLAAGRRILAEREALIGSLLGILLTVKDVLRRCKVPVDVESEPNAGSYAETD